MLVVIFMKGPYLMIVGGTELSAVGVSGDSAGGLISVVVTHLVEGLDFQVFRFSPHLFLSRDFTNNRYMWGLAG